MFGLTDPSRPSKRKKRPKTNLEFSFEELDSTARETQETTSTRQGPVEPATARPQQHTASPISETHQSTQVPASSEARQEKETMDPTINTRTNRPRPIARDNIRRQKREQATVNSLIHGVGLAFTCSILIIAALASLGGYVLYKQLNDQSASLAMLEQNTKQRFFEMETDLIKRDTELAKNLEQTNLRLMNMTSSFEEFRSQSMEMLADLRSTNQTLARQLNQARQENAEQRMKLARLETNVRLRR
ncbi:MAG: hypothetical protein AAF649_06545 [Verrucomicrobiota bacterium]